MKHLALAILNLTSVAAFAVPFDMEDAICSSKAIVVGRLTELDPKFVSMSYLKADETHVFDRGTLDHYSILKGRNLPSPLVVAIDNEKASKLAIKWTKLPRAVGTEGIWFLSHSNYLGFWEIYHHPENPLDRERYQEIRATISAARCNEVVP